MAQPRVTRTPGALLKASGNQDNRAKENRRRNQGVIVGLDILARTARVDVGFYDKQGNPQYLEAVPYPAQLNPSIGDIVTLDYPHTSPGSIRITTTGLAGSNSTSTVSTVPHTLLDGLMDSDTVAGSPSQGSLIAGNNGTPSKWQEVPPAGANGEVLVSDNTQATGVKWSGSATLPTPGKAWDILIANASLAWIVAQVVVDISGNLVTDNGELTVATG